MRSRFSVSLLGLFVACASSQANRISGATAFPGSSEELSPRVLSAGALGQGDMMVSVDLPHAGYVSTLRVLDGAVSVLSTTPSEEMARSEMTAGAHKLALRTIPVMVRPNVVRVTELQERSVAAREDVAQRPSSTYALVIVTERPVSWETIQSSLAPVELNTDPATALARVARAIGDGSGGRWGAGAAKAQGI